MSAKISGLVWELELAPMDKFVLLAYADHADHLGHNVRPSLKLICRKTRLKERAVQYVVQRLRAAGYMIPVRHLEGGRGHTTEYRIALPPEPPGKGAPDDTLSETDLSEGVDTYAPEPSCGKGAPDDTLYGKGAPDDTLSGERVHVATGKGAPDDRKGAPGCTPIPRSKILNPPPPTSPSLGEGDKPLATPGGKNGSADAPEAERWSLKPEDFAAVQDLITHPHRSREPPLPAEGGPGG
jgi:hypothetical protein